MRELPADDLDLVEDSAEARPSLRTSTPSIGGAIIGGHRFAASALPKPKCHLRWSASFTVRDTAGLFGLMFGGGGLGCPEPPNLWGCRWVLE